LEVIPFGFGPFGGYSALQMQYGRAGVGVRTALGDTITGGDTKMLNINILF